MPIPPLEAGPDVTGASCVSFDNAPTGTLWRADVFVPRGCRGHRPGGRCTCSSPPRGHTRQAQGPAPSQGPGGRCLLAASRSGSTRTSSQLRCTCEDPDPKPDRDHRCGA